MVLKLRFLMNVKERTTMNEIKDFELDGKTIPLKIPIQLEINELNGYYYASNNEIELYGNGETKEKAIENARELFSKWYVLSKKIIEYVEFVEVKT